MTSQRGRLLALMAGCVLACGARAAEDTVLDRYLAGLSTWTASFTQTTEDGSGKSVVGGSGRLVIVRPGKLRWESTPEGATGTAQVLVADGANLWFHDVDLDQATVKPLAGELPRSPLMLLAGGGDLRGAFNVQDGGRRDGLDWVHVLPKDPASDFREARFGFKGGELSRLLILDKLGQASRLTFRDVKRNAPVDPALTEFVLPPGVDLIGKPVVP